MTVTELIDLLSLCRPDAEVQVGEGNCTVEFLSPITDFMVWSGAPILWMGRD
jgi:hypothetical protein